MSVHIDATEVNHLTIDLRGADNRIQRKAPGVMKRGALEVKRNMMADFSGHRYAGAVPFSLEFEQIDGAGLAFEVGEIDSGGPQWGIAAILAYGTSNNAPNVDHVAGLRKEAPQIELHLADEAEDAALG